jgi:hypothetical protein
MSDYSASRCIGRRAAANSAKAGRIELFDEFRASDRKSEKSLDMQTLFMSIERPEPCPRPPAGRVRQADIRIVGFAAFGASLKERSKLPPFVICGSMRKLL